MSQISINTSSLSRVLELLGEKAKYIDLKNLEISVDSNGLIIAEVGNYTSTHQLAFQEAKIITPSAVSQVAISSGYYAGGDILVEGDSNLVAENIKNGVSIFGVSGTLSDEDAIIAKTISGDYANNRITNIGAGIFSNCSGLTSVSFQECTIIDTYAFNNCRSLTSVSFPVCEDIRMYAFSNCNSLVSVSFPACKKVNYHAFDGCIKLTSVSFPACTSIGAGAFNNCTRLTSVDFPACTNIYADAFRLCVNLTSVVLSACQSMTTGAFVSCYRLSQLYLKTSSVCTLGYSNAFNSTPYAGYSLYFSGIPYIYVPESLVSVYKSATNWTYFSSYISGI